MPAIITHYSFALDIIKDDNREFEKAILVGSQGPDPFFFYSQVPWNKRKGGKALAKPGALFHHMDLTEPYLKLIEYANKSSHKELLFSYIEGLFMHYSLDRRCHPYVFAMTGNNDGTKENKLFQIAHIGMETALDCLIGKKYGTLTSHPQKMLNLKKEEALEIGKMWKYAIDATLNIEGYRDDVFMLSLKDYKAVLRIANNPRKISHWFVGLVMGKMSEPYAMYIPHTLPKKYEGVDFFNEKHEEWQHPSWDDKYTDSFFDLWEKAKGDYLLAKSLLEKAKNGADIKDELKAFVSNIDHDGGHVGDKKTHFHYIWPEMQHLNS